MNKTVFLLLVMIILMFFSGCSQQVEGGSQSLESNTSVTETDPIETGAQPSETQAPTPVAIPEPEPIEDPITIPNTIDGLSMKIKDFTKSYEGMWVLNSEEAVGTVMVYNENYITYHFSIYNIQEKYGYNIEGDSLVVFGEASFDNGDIRDLGNCFNYMASYEGFDYLLAMNMYSSDGVDYFTMNRLDISAPESEFRDGGFTGIEIVSNYTLEYVPKDMISGHAISIYDPASPAGSEYSNFTYPMYSYREEADLIVMKKNEIIPSLKFNSGIEIKNFKITDSFIYGTIINASGQESRNTFLYIRPIIGEEIFTNIISSKVPIYHGQSTSLEIPSKVMGNSVFDGKHDGYIVGLISLEDGVYNKISGVY